ncbi:MAG: HAMP domain-containing histidine kinase [Actinomycetia bacterium]|nr:HAMP domain-containing histidine kinase [Actinomycetes bacterium]
MSLRARLRAGSFRSIRWRLVAAFAGVSLLTLVVVGVMFYALLGGYVVDRHQDLLLEQVAEVAEQVEGLGEALPTGVVGSRVVWALLRADLRVLPSGAGIVVFRDGEVVAKAGPVPGRDEYLQRLRSEAAKLGADGPAAGVISSVSGRSGRRSDLLVAAAPVDLFGESGAMAVVMMTREAAFAARTEILRALLIPGVIAIALAILVGWGLGTWMTRPLRRLSASARRMAQGSYDQPVTGSYSGEVQELAASMETMRTEVRRSEDSLRGFVASAAHELRTPLTSIQGFSQALLDGTAATPEQRRRAAAAVYRESTRLRRLVDALLTLSRYDSHEFRPNLSSVAVDVLMAEEAERLVEAGLAEPGRIMVEAAPDTRVTTDGDMLRQVIANLLRNAVEYGGSDPVTARAWLDGRELKLEVANGGEPLAPEDRARIFERFYRGRVGRQTDGFGLGLALVWEICEVLGGSVELVEGGPPTRFRVTLPSEGPSAVKTPGA